MRQILFEHLSMICCYHTVNTACKAYGYTEGGYLRQKSCVVVVVC